MSILAHVWDLGHEEDRPPASCPAEEWRLRIRLCEHGVWQSPHKEGLKCLWDGHKTNALLSWMLDPDGWKGSRSGQAAPDSSQGHKAVPIDT